MSLPKKFPSKFLIIVMITILTCIIANNFIAHSQKKEKTWLYNPPEYYKKIRQERIRRISDMRQNINLQDIPRFHTLIQETEKHISLERETWSLHFNKQSGMIDRVKLLDVVQKESCRLSDLELTDTEGAVYRQSFVKDATLTTRDEKFHYLLTAEFQLATSNGKIFPALFRAEYDLFKMSGMLTVRYRVLNPGKKKVRRLQFINTLGPTTPRLDIFNMPRSRGNDESHRFMAFVDIPEDRKGLISSGFLPYVTWTNGRIGLHAAPRRYTYDQMKEFDDPAARGNRVRAEIVDDAAHITFRFIDRQARGVALKKDQSFDFLLGFMPFRKPGPVRVLTYANPPLGKVIHHASTGNQKALESYFRDVASKGATATTSTATRPGETGCMYASTDEKHRKNAEVTMGAARKYGMEIIHFRLSSRNYFKQAEQLWDRDRPIPIEDYEKIMKEPWPEKASSNETPETRAMSLDINCSQFITNRVDGIYEDLHSTWTYYDPNETPRIEGCVRYCEDMWLLCHSFDPPKFFLMHSNQSCGIMESVPDIVWPGEFLEGMTLDELPRAMLETAYNPFVQGSQTYGYQSAAPNYNYSSSKLIKQFFRNAIMADMKYGGKEEDRVWPVLPKHIRKAWEKYFLPLCSFDTRHCELHMWRDPEVARWCKPFDPDLKVNVFSRAKEILVTGAHMASNVETASCQINVRHLGLDGDEFFAYDVLNDRPRVVSADKSGWVELSFENLVQDPLIVCLKEKHGDGPAVIWADHNLEIYGEEIVENVYQHHQSQTHFKVKMGIRALTEEMGFRSLILYSGKMGEFGQFSWPPNLYCDKRWRDVSATKFMIGRFSQIVHQPVTGPGYDKFEINFVWDPDSLKPGAEHLPGWYFPK